MHPGAEIDGRFEIHELAGSGGMGHVYRARDLCTGELVALKLLRDTSADATSRFAQEIRVLAELRHPHIVRYIDHGGTALGEPYLVMEWLPGQTLAERFTAGGLGIDESIALAYAVAQALGAAHARGIIHRDIKPSNLFLVDGAAEHVKILDFGLAHLVGTSVRLTMAGSLLGTPGYIAPEQARSDGDSIDARADVFSLGCVLFECLTGRPAFEGQHTLALLMKLLMEEVPRASELRPEVPGALDALVTRMLAKSPAHRPAHGAEVARLLTNLDHPEESLSARHRVPTEVITTSEKQLLSIIAIRPVPADESSLAAMETLAPGTLSSLLDTVRPMAAAVGASAEMLLDGTLIVVLTSVSNAVDQAGRSALCALRIRALLPEATMALVTGYGEATGRLPVGEVMERAAELLERHASAPRRDAGQELAGGTGPAVWPAIWPAIRPAVWPAVWVDEVTRSLLDGRFQLEVQAGEILLVSERGVDDDARMLLGKPSPFVGRERELRNLCDLVEESFEERSACAVLVTAEAGMGKSRLRHEFMRLVRASYPRVGVAVGRGDSIGAGSAYAMLSTGLRSALGVQAGMPVQEQWQIVAESVSTYVAEPKRERVTAFLGELMGIPAPAGKNRMLEAARQSAAIMADQIEAAYLELIGAMAGTRPVLLVLEDVHWGDAPSIKLVDAVLRELGNAPITVIAFARPDVHTVFPELWSQRRLHEIRLLELPRRAAERLVREFLGTRIDAARAAAIVGRASGNAFYLEELIRAVAEGNDDALPETVLGMVEVRLQALDPEARRVLRAASVFGEIFWKRGVLALLGEELPGMESYDWFAELARRELIARRGERKFAGEEEYAFRHTLIREGAYAMLTDRDRARGHKLAADWLQDAGEQDAMILAEHRERGGDDARAVELYAQAAEQALRGADWAAAIIRAGKGLACGATGETRAWIHCVQAEAYLWMGDYARGHEAAAGALEASEPASVNYCRALTEAIGCAHLSGNRDASTRLVMHLSTLEPPDGAVSWVARAFHISIIAMLLDGARDTAETYMHRLEEIAIPVLGSDLIATTWYEVTLAWWSRCVDRDPWDALERDQAAVRYAELAGDRTCERQALVFIGLDYVLLGALEQAEQVFEHALPDQSASVSGLLGVLFRSFGFLYAGRFEEAHELAEVILQNAEPRSSGYVLTPVGRLVKMESLLRRDELEQAEAEARAMGDPGQLGPHVRDSFLLLCAELKLRQGRASDALRCASDAMASRRTRGMVVEPWQQWIPVIYAEALHATGDTEAACQAIREVRDDILTRAAKILDPGFRQSFLEGVPAHARAQALAHAWLGEA